MIEKSDLEKMKEWNQEISEKKEFPEIEKQRVTQNIKDFYEC